MMRRIFRSQAGQALVETALVLPLVLFLILCTIDFSLMLLSYNQVEMAGSESVRLMAMGESLALVQTTITSAYPGVTITVVYSPLDEQGDTVTVTSTKTYEFVTPVLPVFFGSSGITLTATDSAMIEQT